ncbi:MAG: hypothetical protein ABW022_15830 [Actinoplanes sp.]
MSTSQLEDGPTRRLTPQPRPTHNQGVRHYKPRHAAVEPEQVVTPEPVRTPVGDTTTRMPFPQVQQVIAAPPPGQAAMPLPPRTPGAELERLTALEWSRNLLGRGLRALRDGAK